MLVLVDEAVFRSAVADWHQKNRAALSFELPNEAGTLYLLRYPLPSGISMLYAQQVLSNTYSTGADTPRTGAFEYLGLYDPRDGRFGDSGKIRATDTTDSDGDIVCDWTVIEAFGRVRETLIDAALQEAQNRAASIAPSENHPSRESQVFLRCFLIASGDLEDWERSLVSSLVPRFFGCSLDGYTTSGLDGRDLFANEEETRTRYIQRWLAEHPRALDAMAEDIVRLRAAYSSYRQDPDPALATQVEMYQAVQKNEDVRFLQVELVGPNGTCTLPVERKRLLRELAAGAHQTSFVFPTKKLNEIDALFGLGCPRIGWDAVWSLADGDEVLWQANGLGNNVDTPYGNEDMDQKGATS